MGKKTFSNKFLDFELAADNSYAFRRVLGMEEKNRIPVRVMVERELVEAAGGRPRSGELSNMINMGLNMYLISCHKI